MSERVTEAERISRHEVILEFLEKQIVLNGQTASEGIKNLSDKLDIIDSKWDTRFNTLEESQRVDARDLEALKNKGAGILTAIGVIFTATATIFSEFFTKLNHAVFGG